MGEAGSEHLLQWCPAVTEAWGLCGGRGTLGNALRHRISQDETLRKVPHQTSYLYHVVHRETSLRWQEAASRIAAQ
eukprot:2823717-Lingulodinium_polyedra.AAC.1